MEQSLNSLGFKISLDKTNVKAKPGANIIFLSLESLELGFISGPNKFLAPNLNNLIKQNNIKKLIQVPGGGWTVASMYIVMTGIPCIFDWHGGGNEIFRTVEEIEINTLPNVLSVAGYEQKYFLGGAGFAGMGRLLNATSITAISDNEINGKKCDWGTCDLDVFNALIDQLSNRLDSNPRPFAYFLSSTATHPPKFNFDERMLDLVEKGELNDNQYAIKCTDYLVGEVIKTLQKNNLMANTKFYIIPDHLYLSNNMNLSNPRSLYLISNTQKETPNEDSIYQIDIPKYIIETANIETNAQWITDEIDGDKLNFIENHKSEFASLNKSVFNWSLFEKGIDIYREETDNIFIRTESGEKFNNSSIVNPTYFNFDLLYRLNRDNNCFPKDNNINLKIEKDSSFFDVKILFNEVVLFEKLKIKNHLHISEKELKFISSTINSRIASSKINNLIAIEPREYIRFGEEKIEVEEGLKVYPISFKNDQNSYLNGKITIRNKFVEDSLNLINKYKNVPIAELQILENKFDEKLYIFNLIHEIKSIPKSFFLQKEKTDTLLILSDKNKFIATKAGDIQGFHGTNSLEALNNSYKKGFRLFELDINITNDGHYVAAPSWDIYNQISNTKGVPNITEFLGSKIYNRFTPIDMVKINEWFKNHEDAILITNNAPFPVKFVSKFIDKNRLKMKLSNLKEIKEVNKLDIDEIIGKEDIFLKNKTLSKLIKIKEEYNIESFNVPMIWMEKNVYRFEKLRHHFKFYATGLNRYKGRDEVYMSVLFNNYIYGFECNNYPNFKNSLYN